MKENHSKKHAYCSTRKLQAIRKDLPTKVPLSELIHDVDRDKHASDAPKKGAGVIITESLNDFKRTTGIGKDVYKDFAWGYGKSCPGSIPAANKYMRPEVKYESDWSVILRLVSVNISRGNIEDRSRVFGR